MRDLALHILDLVQNSVEAGAKNVCLKIKEDLARDLLSITIQDDGKGMSKELLEQVHSPFVTSRTTRKVGLGIPLIDMSTSAAGGRLELESESGKGTKICAIYQYSHLDRPPLGDIITTIKLIVVSYQQIFFFYKHEKNGKEFVLATKEMRELLGKEIDFSDYLVREWLDGYLREGLSLFDEPGEEEK